MSYLFDSGPQGLDGSYHFGGPGLGVLGSVIRATTGTGEHGAGYLYNDWDDASDDAKEFQGLVLTPPADGTFFAFEDGSFSLVDAADGTYTFVYRLYVDGVDEGTATATIVIGAGLPAITGESSITLGAVTSTAEGVVIAAGILGQSSVTLGAVVSVAEGVVLTGIVGQSAVTLGDVLSVAAGTVTGGVGPSNCPTAEEIAAVVRAGLVEEIAAAVLAAMNISPPGVDVKRMNGAQVIGTGAPDDLWRGAE